MRIYISGPMTGIPKHNYPKFNRFATELREQGYDVVNPAELDDVAEDPAEWHHYLRRDIVELVGCDSIFMLDGWENSKGAKLEHHLAIELGFENIIYERDVL